jgi:hypothetical protein
MVAHRPHSYGLAALLVVLLIFLCSRGGGGSGGGNGNNNGNGGSSAAGGGFLRWRPLLLFSQAQAEDDPLLPPLRAPVPQIDEEEFEQLVHSKRPVLVDFFAPSVVISKHANRRMDALDSLCCSTVVVLVFDCPFVCVRLCNLLHRSLLARPSPTSSPSPALRRLLSPVGVAIARPWRLCTTKLLCRCSANHRR